MAKSRFSVSKGKRAFSKKSEQERESQKRDNKVQPTLLKADAFTNAPKVSRRSLTKEERKVLEQQQQEELEQAAQLSKQASFGSLGRWWARLRSGPNRLSFGMAIVTLGVVYGDIGTSPLYTVQTFLNGQGGLAKADKVAVLGMLSLIFWSITLITSVKYVTIAMKVDNNGEGGIFSLYSLIRKYGAWLAIPAMLGGAAFLADSVLTPAVSISSAVEGLRTIPALTNIFEDNPSLTLILTIIIIALLFSVQSRGTERIGRVFGSIVMLWFVFLAIEGVLNLSNDWSVILALNPVYGVEFLFSPHNFSGIALMGTVFLSTTGAEALYSDMGHVGRRNIYFTWPFIKIALVLNYFGQGAWILANRNNPQIAQIPSLNPFFQMVTPNVRTVAVVLSVTAGIIASQALITGAFTMVSEATGLNWMPHLQVRYPARTRGQLYIPVVNVVLCIATMSVLVLFRDSEHISAAYGLALTITMINTNILLTMHIWHRGKKLRALLFCILFLIIEVTFFISSLAKFLHGGWFTIALTMIILLVMLTWHDGTKIERSQRRHMAVKDFLPALDRLHGDNKIPYFSDNIVYLTSDTEMKRLDTDIFFSIFADHPKRARAWWAVSVQTTDEPFTRGYSVENFGTDYLFRVRIRLGFKVSQSIPVYIHQIMHDLSHTKELPQQVSMYPKVDADPDIGTIRYVLLHKALMPESNLTGREALSLQMKYAIRRVAGSPVKWFGLAPYNPLIEVQPLFVSTRRPPRLRREPIKHPVPQVQNPSENSGNAPISTPTNRTENNRTEVLVKNSSKIPQEEKNVQKTPKTKSKDEVKAETKIDAKAQFESKNEVKIRIKPAKTEGKIESKDLTVKTSQEKQLSKENVMKVDVQSDIVQSQTGQLRSAQLKGETSSAKKVNSQESSAVVSSNSAERKQKKFVEKAMGKVEEKIDRKTEEKQTQKAIEKNTVKKEAEKKENKVEEKKEDKKEEKKVKGNITDNNKLSDEK